jgi:hypothetical protein
MTLTQLRQIVADSHAPDEASAAEKGRLLDSFDRMIILSGPDQGIDGRKFVLAGTQMFPDAVGLMRNIGAKLGFNGNFNPGLKKVEVEVPAGLGLRGLLKLVEGAAEDGVRSGDELARCELWINGAAVACATCCPVCLMKAKELPEGSYQVRVYPARWPNTKERHDWGRLDVFGDGISVLRGPDGLIWRSDSI